MKKLEGRELIARLAENLRAQKRPMAWAQDAAERIERFLCGDAKSLDAAFDLARKKWPRRKAAQHKSIARKVIVGGLSTKQAMERLGGRNGVTSDERTLRRIVDRYRPEIVEEMAARISARSIMPRGRGKKTA